MLDRGNTGCKQIEVESACTKVTTFTAAPQLHIDNGLSDPGGDHASIFALANDSAPAPDLSDELTVEFLEMVRNWKRADDEH